MLKSYALYIIIAVIGAIQLIVLFSENGNLNKKDYGYSKEKMVSSIHFKNKNYSLIFCTGKKFKHASNFPTR